MVGALSPKPYEDGPPSRSFGGDSGPSRDVTALHFFSNSNAQREIEAISDASPFEARFCVPQGQQANRKTLCGKEKPLRGAGSGLSFLAGHTPKGQPPSDAPPILQPSALYPKCIGPKNSV